ncbi:MAG TPA: hypothetical protein VK919_14590, partial [Solirubrobacterales bacterium]|nr:hypothetical protein [Solirubrobacterales bacterium]
RRERAAPPPRPPRRRGRTAAKLALALLLVAAIGFGAWYGARQVYFLGSDDGGRLALYRGLPYDLPFDVELYSRVHSAPVQVDSLPEDRRPSATDHQLRSRSDAIGLLRDLETAAATPAAGASQGGAGANDGGGDRERRGQRQRQANR